MTPNATIIDCEFVDCGTAIGMDGGYVEVDGLKVTGTPTVFDLNGGAVVDASRVEHDVMSEPLSGNRAQRRAQRKRAKRQKRSS